MPRKKEEYSTLDQIVNALLKKEKLDDSKYQKLQNVSVQGSGLRNDR